MRRLAVVLLVAAIGVSGAVTASPAGAETTFKPKGNVVTITLQVDVFAGENARTGPDGQRIDRYFEQAVRDTWGAAFARLPYKSCYRFELVLDLELFDINARGRSGSHKIYVGTETRGWKGVGWDGVPSETSRDGDTGDGTRSFEHDRSGDLPANAPPTVVAHEFGHLFGLGDDRADGAPKPGRDHTMMVGGVPGVDVDVVQQIDQALIDRIGRVLEHTEQGLARCVSFSGPVRSTVSGGADCTGSESGTLTVAVVDGVASGAAELAGSYTCSGITVPTAGTVQLAGTLDDGLLELHVVDVAAPALLAPVCVVGDRFELPVERGSGRASFSTTAPSGDVYECTVELERREPDEPVG